MSRYQSGQALMEYLIIVAMVAIASISVVAILGQNLRSKMASVSAALDGRERNYQLDNFNRSDVSRRDLGNFMNGAGND